ncbi:MAG: glycine/sarcosine/betaine reductase component B subunit [Dethiobacteria bacterium]
MRLELGRINITDIRFGEKTEIQQGVLVINDAELKVLLADDPNLVGVDLDLAKPGEDVRIIPVKDVIEPRCKVEGPGGVFPGFISKVETVGSGRTHVLSGMAVVTTGDIVGFQEGIIDMSGPGADYTPFSKTLNLVVSITPLEGLPQHKHEHAVRMVGLKAAAYLGSAAVDLTPDQVEIFELGNFAENAVQYPTLPKVAYLYMLQTQGLLHDTYVYGVDAKKILPSLISPTEVMDGAIVSGNCVSACDKNTTYHHQNNPVIRELLLQHGKELCFHGVVISNENVTLADKIRSSDYAAKLVKMIGAEGAIVSEEGFGNPDTDLIMNCRKLEEMGIKTVLITDEYAGRDGASQSLADATPLADAVISVGNANEVIELPACKKIIGNLKTAEIIAGGFSGALHADGSIKVEIQAITGSTNELGFSKLRGEGF